MSNFFRPQAPPRNIVVGYVIVRRSFDRESYDMGTYKKTPELSLKAMEKLDRLDFERDHATRRPVRLVQVEMSPLPFPKKGSKMTPIRVVKDLTDRPFPGWKSVFVPELDMEIPEEYLPRVPQLIAELEAMKKETLP